VCSSKGENIESDSPRKSRSKCGRSQNRAAGRDTKLDPDLLPELLTKARSANAEERRQAARVLCPATRKQMSGKSGPVTPHFFPVSTPLPGFVSTGTFLRLAKGLRHESKPSAGRRPRHWARTSSNAPWSLRASNIFRTRHGDFRQSTGKGC